MEFGEETIIGRIISRKHLVMQFPELLFHFPLLVMRHILKNRIEPDGTHWFITDCKQHLWPRHKYRMGRPCSISCGPIRHQSPDWRQHKKTVSRRGRKVTICKSAAPAHHDMPTATEGRDCGRWGRCGREGGRTTPRRICCHLFCPPDASPADGGSAG